MYRMVFSQEVELSRFAREISSYGYHLTQARVHDIRGLYRTRGRVNRSPGRGATATSGFGAKVGPKVGTLRGVLKLCVPHVLSVVCCPGGSPSWWPSPFLPTGSISRRTWPPQQVLARSATASRGWPSAPTCCCGLSSV